MANRHEIDIRGRDNTRSAFAGVINHIKEVDNKLQATNRTGASFGRLLGSFTLGNVLSNQLDQLLGKFRELTSLGIKYNAQMETSKLGIASIITSQAKILDATGRELSGREALNATLKISQELMNELQLAGLQTSATTSQLVEGFQNAVGPALAMGLSLRETEQITLAVVQAAGALGIPMNQINEEVRSIVSGTITFNSRVAKVLGLTNQMVKDWAASGTLAEELNKRLAAFKTAGVENAKTWRGLTSNLAQAIEVLSGGITADVFADLKKAMQSVLDSIIKVKDGSIQIAPGFEQAKIYVNELWQSTKNLGSAIIKIAKDWGLTDALKETVKMAIKLIHILSIGFKKIADSGYFKILSLGPKLLSKAAKGWGTILDYISNSNKKAKDFSKSVAESGKQADGAATNFKLIAQLSQEKIDNYRKAYAAARDYLERETNIVRRLEESKQNMIRETQRVREEMARDQERLQERLAGLDKSKERLERELAILTGERGALTEQERKQDRIKDIQERLAQIEKERERAIEESKRKQAQGTQKILELNKKIDETSKKYNKISQNIEYVKKALIDSSNAQLKWTGEIDKSRAKAVELARALRDAGQAIQVYNRNLPDKIKDNSSYTIDFKRFRDEMTPSFAQISQGAARAQEAIDKIANTAPQINGPLQQQRNLWSAINEQADKYLEKLNRITEKTKQVGSGINTPDYAPGY